MSLQWTLIATFLYIEVAIILLMMLPLIKPTFWRKFFRSRFVQSLVAQSNLYLVAFVAVLLLFFVESIREYRKYGEKVNNHNNPNYNTNPAAFFEDEMRLFRGQRNFYIAGFALFCLFVIKRLANLISAQAFLMVENDVIKQQARQISDQATRSVETNSAAGDVGDLGGKLSKLQSKLAETELEKEKLVTRNEELKKRVVATNEEYDRLTKEYQKLQNQKQSLSESSKDR